MKKYVQINKKDISDIFEVKPFGDKFEIKIKGTKPIYINLPFILDENVAALAGLMPDGSLIKDLARIYFAQKKDPSKVYLFIKLLKKLFSPKCTLLIRKHYTGGLEGYINSQVVCKFLYYVLGFNKSDEAERIPKWIFTSPDSVKRVYIREVFAMEGCIEKWPRKIFTMVCKDRFFLEDLQKLLLYFRIKSTIKTRIGGIRKVLQYKLFISGRENLLGFKEIEFTYPMHKERFERLVNFYEK